jgi:hypothetical protein
MTGLYVNKKFDLICPSSNLFKQMLRIIIINNKVALVAVIRCFSSRLYYTLEDEKKGDLIIQEALSELEIEVDVLIISNSELELIIQQTLDELDARARAKPEEHDDLTFEEQI